MTAPAPGTTTTEKVDSLVEYYRNARQGDVDEIAESLDQLGQYKPIVVNIGSKTGREREILAGNQTWKAHQKNGLDEIKCYWVDVDDQDAAKINVYDNGTARKGGFDLRMLADQLTDLPTLRGSGYTRADLDQMMRETAAGAQMAVDQISASMAAREEQQRREQPLAAQSVVDGSHAEATFSDRGTAPITHTDQPAPGVTVLPPDNPPVAAPEEPAEPYFTVSYTLTGAEREVVFGAIRAAIAASDGQLKSPAALVEICRAYTGGGAA